MKKQTSSEKLCNDLVPKEEKQPRFSEKELLKDMTSFNVHADEMAVLDDNKNERLFKENNSVLLQPILHTPTPTI